MRNMQSDERRRLVAVARLQVASVALAIAFVFLFGSILSLLTDGVVSAVFPDAIGTAWYSQLSSTVPMYLLALPLSLLLLALGEAEPPKRQRMSPWVWLALLAICFCVTYFGNFLGAWVGALLERLTGVTATNAVEQRMMPAPLWSNLLFIGLLAPVMEELLYRKLAIDRLRRYGELPALLISGLGFGLIHGNVSQLFYASLIGLLLGYVYLRTGNILHTVLLHVAINLIGGVYTTEMYRVLDAELMASDPSAALAQSPVGAWMYWGYLIFLAVTAIGAAAALVPLLRKWYRRPVRAEEPLSRGEWVRVLALNPAVWIFLTVVVMLFAL